MPAVIAGRTPQHAAVERIGDNVALSRSVIHTLRERVRQAVGDTFGKPLGQTDLQTVVNGIRIVIRDADGGVTLIRTQVIDIDARIGLNRSDRGRVNVALALLVNGTAPNIGNFHGVSMEVMLNRSVPLPGFRILEDWILRRQDEREVQSAAGRSAARGVHKPIGDGHSGLERRVAAQKHRVANAKAGKVTAHARTERRLRIKRIRKTEPRLPLVVVDRRVGFVALEQALVLGVCRSRETSLRGIGEAAAGDDQSVVDVTAARNNVARFGILLDRFRRIVGSRVEHRHVAPQAEVRLDDRVAYPEIQVELGGCFPAILDEAFEHVTAVGRVGTRTQFRIGVEEPQNRVGNGQAGTARATVRKHESTILVIGGAGDVVVNVYLIEVVLALVFPRSAELDGVGAVDPGEVVGKIVDGTSG